MEGPIGVLAIIGGVVTILGALAAVVAFVGGSYNKALIESLRGDVAQYLERIQYLEREEVRHKEHEGKWREERQHLIAENQTLLMAATKSAEVEKVSKQLDGHHTQAMAALGHIGIALDKLVERGSDV